MAIASVHDLAYITHYHTPTCYKPRYCRSPLRREVNAIVPFLGLTTALLVLRCDLQDFGVTECDDLIGRRVDREVCDTPAHAIRFQQLRSWETATRQLHSLKTVRHEVLHRQSDASQSREDLLRNPLWSSEILPKYTCQLSPV